MEGFRCASLIFACLRPHGEGARALPLSVHKALDGQYGFAFVPEGWSVSNVISVLPALTLVMVMPDMNK